MLKFFKKNNWWDSGINFSCQPNCGKCCDEPDGIVYLSMSDIKRLAEFHKMNLQEWVNRDCKKSNDGRYILKSNEDLKCIYFNSELGCDVYESKPNQCNAFPWWNENLVNKKSWDKTKKICPGIDHPDAILIDKNTIKFWVKLDTISEQGVRNIHLENEL
mgnify:FL=1